MKKMNVTVEKKIHRTNKTSSTEKLFDVTDNRIKWTRQVKRFLEKGIYSQLEVKNFRVGCYRPFAKRFIYFYLIL